MGEKTCKHTLVINSKFVDSSDDVIILGKTIDKKLTFSKAKIDSNFIAFFCIVNIRTFIVRWCIESFINYNKLIAFHIMVIKVFHYSNLAFVKSNLIAKKIIQLYLDCYMMSLNLSSFVTPKIELQS